MLLDVTRLPRTAPYQGGMGERPVDLASIVRRMQPTFDDWSSVEVAPGLDLVKPHTSFGFAMAKPHAVNGEDWDDPYEFTWFVAGWGPEQDRYIANAVRKLRALLRTGLDTALLRVNGASFDRPVESAEPDGSFAWGDFPYGGAKLLRVGWHLLPCAASSLREVEDDMACCTIGGHIGATMLKIDDPERFA